MPDESDEHRHACEVRMVQAMPNDAARRAYLFGSRGVEGARGIEAAERINRDLKEPIT